MVVLWVGEAMHRGLVAASWAASWACIGAVSREM